MLFIKATDKFKEFTSWRDYKNLGLFLLSGLGMTVLSWFLYYNPIITLTLTVSSLAFFYSLAVPPSKVEIILYDDKLSINKVLVSYDNLVFWAVTELEGKLEITIQKKSISPSFLRFYIEDNKEQLEKVVAILSQNIPYNQETAHNDKAHFILRYLGLK